MTPSMPTATMEILIVVKHLTTTMLCLQRPQKTVPRRSVNESLDLLKISARLMRTTTTRNIIRKLIVAEYPVLSRMDSS